MRHYPQGFLFIFAVIFGYNVGAHAVFGFGILDVNIIKFVKVHFFQNGKQVLGFGIFAGAARVRRYRRAGNHMRLQINDSLFIGINFFE